MWNIYNEDPKCCGHPLDEMDYTCVGCLYVALCLTCDQLREAQDLIAEISHSNSYRAALASDAQSYPQWALNLGKVVSA